MLSNQAQRALIGWEAHCPRIITATFKTKIRRINMDIIQAYAPTNDSKEEDKDEFYNRLMTIIQNRPRRNILILMGDFNAKIGSDNRGYEECMGQQGLGEMNENGERFADLCATNNLVIGGSLFHHKRIHKATWVSPDLSTENQIDHICIIKKFRRSLQDVRVKRGADVASDHHLLVAKVKLKLKKNMLENKRKYRYNTGLLKDPSKLNEFKLHMSNRFQVLQELIEEETIEETWEKTKSILTSTCEEVLGPIKRQAKEWISADTMKIIEERKRKKATLNNSRTRATKLKALEEYTETNKNIKKHKRKYKRSYLELLAREAEEELYHGNIRDMYN